MSTQFLLGRAANQIVVAGDLAIQDVRKVLAVIHDAVNVRGHQDIVFDFSGCTSAFSASVLPLCAKAALLRISNIYVSLILPDDNKLRRLFLNTGWAHFIEPQQYEPPNTKSFAKQFPAVQYKTHEEQEALLNELLEKLLSVIPNFNRNAFAAVEWALNEISDNVLNHSQSSIGGFLQLSVFDLRRCRVEFTISDGGVGVPATLRAAYPSIRDDADALMESVRSGVTRNAEDFQGNGLYGTLEICRVGGGKFSLNAGSGFLYSANQTVTARNDRVPFCGTTVDAVIDFSEPGLLEKALAIDGRVHRPTDYIELRYEQEGLASIPFKLDEQAQSFRSRPAGRPVKTKLSNLVQSCPGQVILVDFAGITVVSSSFADEVFGKLFVEIGPMRFMQGIRLQNVSPTVQALIDRAITQRMQFPSASQLSLDEDLKDDA
jgi:STAS-like domain of unknown function (DUF4325)